MGKLRATLLETPQGHSSRNCICQERLLFSYYYYYYTKICCLHHQPCAQPVDGGCGLDFLFVGGPKLEK